MATLTLGGLDLLDEDKHRIAGQLDISTVGEIKLQLYLAGSSVSQMVRNYQGVLAKLRQGYRWACGEDEDVVELVVDYGTESEVTYIVTGGSGTPTSAFESLKSGFADITIQCLPFARGPMLYIENLLDAPLDFNDADWSKNLITLGSNAAAGPDDSVLADDLAASATTTGVHYARQQITTTASQAYVASVYAKANEITYAELAVDNGASDQAVSAFNLSTGVVVSGTGSIEELWDGWYRLILPFSHAGTTTRVRVALHNGTTNSFSTAAGNGIYIWGAQVNRGTVAAPLICHGGGGPSTSAYTNGTTSFAYLFNVPGDEEMLTHVEITDTSSSGVINRLRGARRSSSSYGYGTFVPWLDAASNGTGSDTVDATALGGSYATLTTTSETGLPFARATTSDTYPLLRGLFDIHGRIYGTGTTMGVPGSFTATEVAPTTTSTTETDYGIIQLGATGSGRSTSATSPSATWSATTTDGSLLIAIGYAQVGVPSGTPTNFSLLTTAQFTSEAGNEIYLRIFYRRDAPATSGALTWAHGVTATAANPSSLMLLELKNADLAISYTDAGSATDTTEPTGPAGAVTAFPNEAILATFAFAGTGTADETDFWFNGYEPLLGANEMSTGLLLVDNVGTTPAIPKLRTTASEPAVLCSTINIKPTKTTTTETALVQPVPGDLLAGAYAFRIQGVDAMGNLSSPTSTTNLTVNADFSAADLTWTASAGSPVYYKITFSFDGTFYYFFTPDSSLACRLTTTADHNTTTALPTGASGTPLPVLWLSTGTSGSAAEILRDSEEYVIDVNGGWRVERLATAMLPPVIRQIAGDRPNAAIQCNVRSINGRDATARCDGFWLVAHGEKQVEIEYDGLALGTLRRWVAESDPRGRTTIAHLESTADGSEQGQLNTAGVMLLEPGNNWLYWLADQASGASSIANASWTMDVRGWARYAWQRGR